MLLLYLDAWRLDPTPGSAITCLHWSLANCWLFAGSSTGEVSILSFRQPTPPIARSSKTIAVAAVPSVVLSVCHCLFVFAGHCIGCYDVLALTQSDALKADRAEIAKAEGVKPKAVVKDLAHNSEHIWGWSNAGHEQYPYPVVASPKTAIILATQQPGAGAAASAQSPPAALASPSAASAMSPQSPHYPPPPDAQSPVAAAAPQAQ